jgi:hypothetical protein
MGQQGGMGTESKVNFMKYMAVAILLIINGWPWGVDCFDDALETTRS